MSVGVTKDYKLKVRNLHASHTLSWSRWFWTSDSPTTVLAVVLTLLLMGDYIIMI